MSEKNKSESFLSSLKGLIVEHFGKVEKVTEVKLKSIKKNEEKFADVKASDGTTVISYDGDMPMVGMPIYVINPADNTRLPMPDGVVELEDGTEIETVGGLIVAIEPAAAEPVEPPAAVPTSNPQMTEAPEQTAKRIIESIVKESHFEAAVKTAIDKAIVAVTESFATENKVLSDKNEALVTELAEAKATVSTLVESFKKFESFSAKMLEQIEKFGGEPQVKPEEKPKEFRNEKPEVKKLTDAEWKAKYMNY